MRRRKFGDISDSRAGIEHDFKNVGFGVFLTLGALALAGRYGGDACGTEIRPDNA